MELMELPGTKALENVQANTIHMINTIMALARRRIPGQAERPGSIGIHTRVSTKGLSLITSFLITPCYPP